MIYGLFDILERFWVPLYCMVLGLGFWDAG